MKKLKRFPIIMKNKNLKLIEIIYQNRVEFYRLDSIDNKDLDGYAEIKMAQNNGFKQVNNEDLPDFLKEG